MKKTSDILGAGIHLPLHCSQYQSVVHPLAVIPSTILHPD